mgnify:CR=1 FL=1
MTDFESNKATMATIKSLITLCKRHKIKRIKFKEFEAEFDPQAFVSKKSDKNLVSLTNRQPTKEEMDEDLYHSAL